MSKKYKVIVVSETHWDRAWYLTFQQFRMRLVEVTNKLFEILKNNRRFNSFTFDGQTVVVEDYLEVVPQKEALYQDMVKKGKIFIGPWYILPDEFLVSGESLIRNLLLGHKIAKRMGRVMKAGYIPDPFGHISQLPQILSGFNIDSVIFSRGMGEEGEKLGSEFIWRGKDGKSSVLAIHQVLGYGDTAAIGYSNDLLLDFDFDRAYERAKRNLTTLKKYANTKYLFFNNGVDHYHAQGNIPEVIDYLNKKFKEAKFIHGTYEDYVKGVKRSKKNFKSWQGEFHNGKYYPILSGVFSSRIYLKQVNERIQTLLEKYTEPYSAIAWLEGYNDNQQNLVWEAWRWLLKNHPHDDICGCSIDEVHRDMLFRFAQAEQIGKRLVDKSLSFISIRVSERAKPKGAEAVVVYNPLNWERTDSVRIKALLKKDIFKDKNLRIIDEEGEEITIKINSLKKIVNWNYIIYPKYATEEVIEADIDILAQKVPGMGYRTYYIIPEEGSNLSQSDLRLHKNGMGNRYYRLNINQNGSINVIDKKTGKRYNNLHVIEDREDAGDEYDYSSIVNTKIFTTKGIKAKIDLIENTNIRISYLIKYNMKIPKRLSPDRKKRSREMVNIPIETKVTLISEVDRIDFTTTINNIAQDHRMRVLFPTNIKTNYAFAETKFDVIRRGIDIPKTVNWAQAPVGTQHQDRFVSINDNQIGLTIINKGLPEYEAIKATQGITMAITFFRSVGWLSRDDLLTRKGHAGPYISTPEAQCLGKNTYKYALTTHKGDWEKARTYTKAYEHNIPMISCDVILKGSTLPQKQSFIEVSQKEIIITAFKKSEKRNSVVVRFFNIGNTAKNFTIKFYKKIKEAYWVDLEENRKKRLNVKEEYCISGLPLSSKEFTTVEICIDSNFPDGSD